MRHVTKKEIQDWLDKTVNSFNEIDFKEGTVYYWESIGKGLALVLSAEWCGNYEGVEENPYAFFDEHNEEWYELEVSVRIARSSYFVDSWIYVHEASMLGISGFDKDNHMEKVAEFLYKIYDEYIEPEEEYAEI